MKREFKSYEEAWKARHARSCEWNTIYTGNRDIYGCPSPEFRLGGDEGILTLSHPSMGWEVFIYGRQT